MIFLFLAETLLLAFGAYQLLCAGVLRDRSFVGRRAMRKLARQQRTARELWTAPPLAPMVAFAARYVYLDDLAAEILAKQLSRAELELTPQEYTARKYVVVALGGAAVALCGLLRFWFGVIMAVLTAIYCLMRLRDEITDRIRKKDAAIAEELPRFVRSVCQQLQTNRDIEQALASYRKVAGPALGRELDILLTHIRSGGVPTALQQFQNRLGTDEAFRFCGALTEFERGADQTAALNHLADDMAQRAKLNVEQRLALRPSQMRATYWPAVGVCVVMIVYVLIVYVVHQLNNLF